MYFMYMFLLFDALFSTVPGLLSIWRVVNESLLDTVACKGSCKISFLPLVVQLLRERGGGGKGRPLRKNNFFKAYF